VRDDSDVANTGTQSHSCFVELALLTLYYALRVLRGWPLLANVMVERGLAPSPPHRREVASHASARRCCDTRSQPVSVKRRSWWSKWI